MKYKIPIRIFIIIAIIMTLISITRVLFLVKDQRKSWAEIDKKDVYYDKYDTIRLSGTIVKKTSLDNDRYSLYEIDVSESNTKIHDLRDSLNVPDYFLVINGTKAQMVYYLSYDIFVEDSVSINYKTRELLVYRKGVLLDPHIIPPFDNYYISMRKKAFGR